MDIWNASKERIIQIAEQKSGKKAVSVLKTSGLWAYITMTDNSIVTVYEIEL